ncbi:MAG: Asp-tRNA(Asn)/Glu-tRNA(Gln) amidotransferase subunit GatC [Methanimicrococcus sp.]|nr:Asp-tRNA(Asn)/Glu-tRNA(Gln) amidotransferase subunit GatC [Methanimicrococcus sp.]
MIPNEKIAEIAWAARIAVDEKDLPEFQKKINGKLDFYAVIQDAPTENVKKTVNPSRLNTVLRKDIVSPSMKTEDALKNAPEVHETSFKIPKIL